MVLKTAVVLLKIYMFTCQFLFQGSRDNMSIVLVLFPGAPAPSPEAIEAEKELDASLENHIKGCFNFSNCTNF